MASPSTLSGDDLAQVRELLEGGLPERAGLRLEQTHVRSVRPETRLRFNSPVRGEAWMLSVSARAADGREYSGEIELFRWPGDGWELEHDGLGLL